MMDKKLETLLRNEKKMEEEKILFGGNIYKNINYLKSIRVTNENIDLLKENLNSIEKIGNQFVEDIIRLHAELYLILGGDKEDNNNNSTSSLVNEISIKTCSIINLALQEIRQINQMIVDCDAKNSDVYLSGKDYCFIAIFLHELFMSYSSLVVILLSKRYLDESYVNAIRERLNLLMSIQYESLRQNFNTVQSFEKSKKASDESLITIH